MRALGRRGHHVDYVLRDGRPYRLPHPTLSRFWELPQRQFRQVARQLASATYDGVIISQPYAYLIYERLAPRYPRTLFLNRTHGWEGRFDAAANRFQWSGDRPAVAPGDDQTGPVGDAPCVSANRSGLRRHHCSIDRCAEFIPEVAPHATEQDRGDPVRHRA